MFRTAVFKLLPLAGLSLAGLSAYVIVDPYVGALTLGLFLLSLGLAWGPRLAPSRSIWLQLSLGIMFNLALASVLGSLVYYSLIVTPHSLMLVLLILSLAASLVANPEQLTPPKLPYWPTQDGVLFTLGSLALVGWWLALSQVHILEPVRSVWLVLNPTSLLAIFLAIACALALLYRGKAPGLGTALILACVFSSLAIVAVTYPLGYGFDPFLHRATVAHIAEFGTITPKPPYYIGLYALELFAVKIFNLPGFGSDVFLVPVLVAWGSVSALSLRNQQVNRPWIGLATLMFLPLSAFVQTTPQALAFTFTLWAVLVPSRLLWLAVVFAVAAVFTHPLAGIGALAYVCLLGLDTQLTPGLGRKLTLGLVTVLASIALPTAFVLQARISGLDLNFTLTQLLHWSRLPIPGFVGSGFNAWGDLAYSFSDNAFVIVIILALLGMIVTSKSQPGWYIPLLASVAVLVNFIIVSLGFDFNYLINYERTDFALRLLTLTVICLLPYLAELLTWVYSKLQTAPVGLSLGLIIFTGLVFTTGTYAAYPRHDNYARSAGFNLSQADFEAVQAIERTAAGRKYIVLSDQALAAAAVQEFGFKQYYPGEIFFYPIPTGGALYQYYLNLVEDGPKLATVMAALERTQAELAFFVVHDYWWQAPAIIENTKALTANWFALNDGYVHVFMFTP